MSLLKNAVHAKDAVSVGLIARPMLVESIRAPFFRYEVTCLAPDGAVKWTEDFTNLVTTVGKNDLLDKYFAGSAYTAAWKLGLKGAGAAAAGDTLASHAGWSEVTPYTGNRPALAWSAASAGSKVATTVSYTINAGATVAGAFVTDQATGTAGILYSAGDFTAARTVANGDTLNVTVTVSV